MECTAVMVLASLATDPCRSCSEVCESRISSAGVVQPLDLDGLKRWGRSVLVFQVGTHV